MLFSAPFELMAMIPLDNGWKEILQNFTCRIFLNSRIYRNAGRKPAPFSGQDECHTYCYLKRSR